MTAVSPVTPGPRAKASRLRNSPLFAFMRSQPLGAAGLIIILVIAIAAIFAEYIAPYNPEAMNLVGMLAPPSWKHPFGTDSFGRDIFTRIIYGARTALAIGFISSFLGCTVGAFIGVASAYFGGRIDLIIQRLIDIILSYPIIVLAMVVVAIFGSRPILGVDLNLILAIAIPVVPRVARVVRSAALAIREMPYVDAARAGGYSDWHIITRHMLPNVLAPYLIMLTAYMAQAILLEASLSFLGLGVSEPTPAWGLMLAGDSASFYEEAPWMIIFPGLAISLAVFAFNLFGDSLRDWLDPKFKT